LGRPLLEKRESWCTPAWGFSRRPKIPALQSWGCGPPGIDRAARDRRVFVSLLS
jgi:hypothetical protein